MAEKILIVEDEPGFVLLIRNKLVQSGFEVVVAQDGHQAYETAQKEKPDLVILDIMIPKFDGYKVCGLLKNDKRFSKIPIILFSAKASDNDAKTAKAVGANAYVTKIMGTGKLIEEVMRLLDEGGRYETE